MKIEKMNEHQIRCILTREDLEMRNIKLSELAYGSENTRNLFQDMMQQASADFGFEAEDIPLMIEAIPLSSEKIVLIITKVDSPEELDTRFSNFTEMEEETTESIDDIENFISEAHDAASELLDIFEHLEKTQSPAIAGDTAPDKESIVTAAHHTRLFLFTSLDEAIRAAQAVGDQYQGQNTIYRLPHREEYQLIVHQAPHTKEDFDKITHTLSTYLNAGRYTPAVQAFCEEHAKVILEDHALQTLCTL